MLLPATRKILLAISLLAAALACNFGNPSLSGAAVTQTYAARVTALMATAWASRPSATLTQTSPTVTPSQAPVPFTPTLTLTLTPTLTLAVVHQMTPGEPVGANRFVTDPLTKDYAPEMRSPSGSDVYQNNRWERPYSAGVMYYLPDIDLTRAELRIAPPWIYITLTTAGERAEGIGQTMYGVEIDRNLDGRGDFLIWGASPAAAAWTTAGVQVWKDSNLDVGGPAPQISDAPFLTGNGYDQSLFNGGQGADPDLAWIRNAGGGKIQLAFKYSLLSGATKFWWNALADGGVRNPAWFDYNDRFTQAEAGSPLTVQGELYPLKALYALDNTCRDPYGFTPTGAEPGVCILNGSISGKAAWDIDHNSVLDAHELSVAVIAGDQVTLGQGACPSAGYRSAVTNSAGVYVFGDLPAGTYCVTYSHSPAPPSGYATPNPVTVILHSAENKWLNFGIPW
jgi:hypothetical protein